MSILVDATPERPDDASVERRWLESTTASRIKALFLAARDARGPDAAVALMERSGVQEDLIADETRPLPVELWYRALGEFDESLGLALLDAGPSSFLHRENLAVWTAVLRGADGPVDAFRQLDRMGGDQGGDEVSASDWRTLAVGSRSWIGTAPLPAQPDDARRATRARLAELRALALLFGCPLRSATFTHHPAQGLTHYEVHWAEPWRGARPVGSALGAGLGGLAGNLVGWLPPGTASVALGAALGAALGLGAAAAGWHDAQRRARARRQAYRIHALERSAALRSRRDASGALFESGMVLGGQFRLRRPIGMGAAGSVWEAERLADGHPVALKLLRTAVAHDSQAADRLRREADALGLAWHPHVVEVLDHGHLPQGVAFLVMELLVGETLAQRLERKPRLDRLEVYELALQVCDALDAIHAAGVVHRDIKPANLFLVEAPGGKLHLKVVDFGVAQVAWAETRLTRSGTPLGTPGYMAPEQEAGRVVDGRSDLFALGGVLYQALVGRPPPIPHARLDADIPDAPPDFAELDPAWRAILQRLLAPWPNQRFADARALREALRALPEAPRALERDTA